MLSFATIIFRRWPCNDCYVVSLRLLLYNNYCLLSILFFQFILRGAAVDKLCKPNLVNRKLYRRFDGFLWWVHSSDARVLWFVFTFFKYGIYDSFIKMILNSIVPSRTIHARPRVWSPNIYSNRSIQTNLRRNFPRWGDGTVFNIDELFH